MHCWILQVFEEFEMLTGQTGSLPLKSLSRLPRIMIMRCMAAMVLSVVADVMGTTYR